MPTRAAKRPIPAWKTKPVDSEGRPLPYPAETLELMSRLPAPGRKKAWWHEAIDEWERQRIKPKWASTWLPGGFDPYKTCPALGSTGLPCADPWCSEPGVIAKGHDRKRAGAQNRSRRNLGG